MLQAFVRGYYCPDLLVLDKNGIIAHTEGWLAPYLNRVDDQVLGLHFREVLLSQWAEKVEVALQHFHTEEQHQDHDTSTSTLLKVLRPESSLLHGYLIVELRASIAQELHPSSSLEHSSRPTAPDWPDLPERLNALVAKQDLSENTLHQTLALAAEIGHLAIWHWLPQENKIVGNQQFQAMYGLGNPFGIDTWQQHVFPEDRGAIDLQVEDILTGASDQFNPHYRYLHPETGKTHFYQEKGIVTDRTAHGKPVLITGVTIDLTESWEKQEQLEETSYFLAKLTENAGYAIYVHDLEKGLDIYANGAYQELLGFTREEINAMSTNDFYDRIHPYDREHYKTYYQRLLEKGEMATIEYRFLRKDGQWIWCLAKDTLFEKKSNESSKRYIGILIDITDRKEMELALMEAKKKAETANIYKNSFLTNMSHEIRTPMNGVVACSQLLDDEDLTAEERHQFIEIIQNSSGQLLRLIDDIIDIARMEAGELAMHYESFSLREFIENVYHSFQSVLKSHTEKTLAFELHADLSTLEVEMYSDSVRLQQVLMNLLGNAMKYSHQGTIELHAELQEGLLLCSVHDQGIGIPQEHFESIFERFNQVEYRSRVKYGGQGLGLAICKGILEQLGGTISVESEVNQGSIFRIALPLTPAFRQQALDTEKRLSSEAYRAGLAGKTVLLVDDEPAILQYLLKALEPSGAQLLCAQNGEEALEIYRKTPRIDAVLMDIRMPLMDGIMATRELMKIDPNALVIIQSAFVMPEERDRSFAAGCKAYLTKPLDKDLLIHTLEQVF